ncbi:MAG: hypothetical protein KDI46_09145 [Alphaproteobacteria bacterium]|nr:hypothetical protein [Alphaproteobacteria bacterium]
MSKIYIASTVVLTAFTASLLGTLALANTAQAARLDTYSQEGGPTIISHIPLSQDIIHKIYNRPAKAKVITPEEISGRSYYKPSETAVSEKARQLKSDLDKIDSEISNLANLLQTMQEENENWAADYYADIATINTQLQSGTTPGNPRLVNRLTNAENKLENLNNSLVNLNSLSVQAAETSANASALLEQTRAAYGMSGGVEEDHVKLAILEDAINARLVSIERILNTTSDSITRTSTFLSSERNDLRALSLAVSNGDLYGKSLANRPFSNVSQYGSPSLETVNYQEPAYEPQPIMPQMSALPAPRPLAKIRFDQPDVAYEQPIYAAVNEALQRYPNARFDLVAVHPTNGNAAKVAIESTKARRNAEKVLRTLTEMGLPLDRIDLSYDQSPEISSNEVRLFVK